MHVQLTMWQQKIIYQKKLKNQGKILKMSRSIPFFLLFDKQNEFGKNCGQDVALKFCRIDGWWKIKEVTPWMIGQPEQCSHRKKYVL